MISRIVGTGLKGSTKNKSWWLKLAGAIVVSNVFFFLLFSGNETTEPAPLPEGFVALELRAILLTPFQYRKKVLILDRRSRKFVVALLESTPNDPEGRFTVLVKDNEAQVLLQHENWEIVPYLKALSFAPVSKGEAHEIRY